MNTFTESLRNNILSKRSICKITVYHYVHQSKAAIEGNAHEVKRIDFDTGDLSVFSYNKGYTEPAGRFTFTLLPRLNYVKLISAGDWVTIRIKNDEIDHIRCVGIVDAITRSSLMNKDGKRHISYEVTCSDFGKVFQLSNIWLNPYEGDNIFIQEFIKQSGAGQLYRADYVVGRVLDSWLDPQSPVGKKYGNPFIVPPEIFKDLGLSGSSSIFNDLCRRLFSSYSVNAYKAMSMPEINGSLWTLLKSWSNPHLNEIVVELMSDGSSESSDNKNGKSKKIEIPTIRLRPYPFSTDSYSGPDSIKLSSVYKDSPVSIDSQSIITSKLGFSDNTHFNIFYLLSTETANKNHNALGQLDGSGYPKKFFRAIQRFGKRVFEKQTNYIVPNKGAMIDWNKQLEDMNRDVSLMYSGIIKIVGNPDVRVGKALIIKNVAEDTDLGFYIFGYSDEWRYPGLWMQTVTVGRGNYIKGGKIILPYDFESQEDIFTGQTVIENVRTPFFKENINPDSTTIPDVVSPEKKITSKRIVNSRKTPTVRLTKEDLKAINELKTGDAINVAGDIESQTTITTDQIDSNKISDEEIVNFEKNVKESEAKLEANKYKAVTPTDSVSDIILKKILF